MLNLELHPSIHTLSCKESCGTGLFVGHGFIHRTLVALVILGPDVPESFPVLALGLYVPWNILGFLGTQLAQQKMTCACSALGHRDGPGGVALGEQEPGILAPSRGAALALAVAGLAALTRDCSQPSHGPRLDFPCSCSAWRR